MDCSSSPYVAPTWPERLSSLPQLYTSTAIAAHSVVDVHKYFPLSEEQQQRIPSQLLAPVADELRLTGGYLQVHAAYIPLIERLARVFEGSKGRAALMKPFGVHGSGGVGKSALLAYLSLWAMERGWLVVAVRADEFSMDKLGWIQPSSDRPGIFEQPLYTQYWLNQLALSQSQLLSRIALKGQYPFAANCHTLLDLIHIARDDATLATSVLYAVVAEVRTAHEVPVLVVMDNVNVWDGASQFVDPLSRTATPLPARRLALVDALSSLPARRPAVGCVRLCHHRTRLQPQPPLALQHSQGAARTAAAILPSCAATCAGALSCERRADSGGGRAAGGQGENVERRQCRKMSNTRPWPCDTTSSNHVMRPVNTVEFCTCADFLSHFFSHRTHGCQPFPNP